MSMKQRLVVLGLVGIGLYLVAAGISYSFFSGRVPVVSQKKETPQLAVEPGKGPKKRFTIDPATPRDQMCPINGVMYTKQEKDVWDKRRPLAAMIENHQEARPQSGLSYADVVYEAVAEGGITRFMGVFYCGIAAQNVSLAPVRSARTYFLPWVKEYDALYNHVGGAGNCDDDTVDTRAKALCQIGTYKIKDMDQFGISFPTCYRNYDRLDHPVATEHTMVCETDKLTKVAADRGWTNVDTKGVAWDADFTQWKFTDEAKPADRGDQAKPITFAAWPGYEKDYGVSWAYDKTSNTYKRSNGGQPHKDLENDTQLSAKNIVILFAKQTGPVDDHGHLLYANIGSGTGFLFQNGKADKLTWQKADVAGRTKFFVNGKEVQFVRGQIWIEMLPTGTAVSY
jgi:hypothetical protein